MSRIYNFSAGPAVLPVECLEQAQADMLDYNGSGMSVMEMSHRGKVYAAIHEEAKDNIRKLMKLTDDYEVIFVQGGASLQFAMIPMNFLGKDAVADYVCSGNWGAQAIKQARLIGQVNVAADCEKDIPTRMPRPEELQWTKGAAYAHITSNETISGAQFKVLPKTEAPLIATCPPTSSPAPSTSRTSRWSTAARRRTSAPPAWPSSSSARTSSNAATRPFRRC